MESQSSLLQTATQLLKDRPIWMSYTQIEAKTGIPEHWLVNISRGKSKNPRVDRLEKLVAYLETEIK